MRKPQKKVDKTNKCPHCAKMFGGSGFKTHMRYCELKNRKPEKTPIVETPPKVAAEKMPDETTDKIAIYEYLPEKAGKKATGWDRVGEAIANLIENNGELALGIAAPIVAGVINAKQEEGKDETQNLDPKNPANDWILKANYFKE